MMRFALLVALCSLMPTTIQAEWKQVTVPSEQSFSGNAYYRTWFKPHNSFFSKHERDLFGESVILNIRGLAGAHAVFVNGTKIGTGGQFPPDFHDGRDGNHATQNPGRGTLVRDQWNELVVKVYNPNGKRRVSYGSSVCHELLLGVRVCRHVGIPARRQ